MCVGLIYRLCGKLVLKKPGLLIVGDRCLLVRLFATPAGELWPEGETAYLRKRLGGLEESRRTSGGDV